MCDKVYLFDFCQAIPLSRQPHLLELVISRLQDKSSIVCKNAIQLLKTCLICNPFTLSIS